MVKNQKILKGGNWFREKEFLEIGIIWQNIYRLVCM